MTRGDRDPERSERMMDRLDGRHYGDPDDHRPAHVAPPDADESGDESRAEPPEDWPEMFPVAGDRCSHLFHWDDADALYRCVACDSTRAEPPEGSR